MEADTVMEMQLNKEQYWKFNDILDHKRPYIKKNVNSNKERNFKNKESVTSMHFFP